MFRIYIVILHHDIVVGTIFLQTPKASSIGAKWFPAPEIDVKGENSWTRKIEFKRPKWETSGPHGNWKGDFYHSD